MVLECGLRFGSKERLGGELSAVVVGHVGGEAVRHVAQKNPLSDVEIKRMWLLDVSNPSNRDSTHRDATQE